MEEKKRQFSYESYVVNYFLFREFSKEKNLIEILKKGRSYSIPDVYDDSYSECRCRQLLDFEFKNWDLGSIETHSIVTVENTRALLECAPQMIWEMLMYLGNGSFPIGVCGGENERRTKQFDCDMGPGRNTTRFI